MFFPETKVTWQAIWYFPTTHWCSVRFCSIFKIVFAMIIIHGSLLLWCPVGPITVLLLHTVFFLSRYSVHIFFMASFSAYSKYAFVYFSTWNIIITASWICVLKHTEYSHSSCLDILRHKGNSYSHGCMFWVVAADFSPCVEVFSCLYIPDWLKAMWDCSVPWLDCWAPLASFKCCFDFALWSSSVT